VTSPAASSTSASAASTSQPSWAAAAGSGSAGRAFLFRTLKGNYFAQFQSTWPAERDRLLPLSQDEAMRLYGELPEKKVSFEEAFPGA
jgi:hypothetical protein